MFQVASEDSIDVYADSVSKFIRKSIGDVVPTVTIKTFPNQKPWVDGSIRAKLKACTTAFNHGKATGNMAEYKQCSYSLHKAIKQAKCPYRDKVESQFNCSNTRRMWQGLQTITDYKKKTSPVADIDILLSDKLNNFFVRFEDNTEPPTRPATKDCGLSFSVTDVRKTFKHVNPHNAARLDSNPSYVLIAFFRPADWCVYGHIQSIPIQVCCPHMLQVGHYCSCSQESQGN
jgi:hypothetical protein